MVACFLHKKRDADSTCTPTFSRTYTFTYTYTYIHIHVRVRLCLSLCLFVGSVPLLSSLFPSLALSLFSLFLRLLLTPSVVSVLFQCRVDKHIEQQFAQISLKLVLLSEVRWGTKHLFSEPTLS